MQKFLNLIALICILAVGFALFSQHVLDMPPCAWCVFQRLIFLVIAAVCLLGNVVSANIFKRFIAFLVFLLGIGGMLSAWYQYDVAAQMFSCHRQASCTRQCHTVVIWYLCHLYGCGSRLIRYWIFALGPSTVCPNYHCGCCSSLKEKSRTPVYFS